MARAAGVSTGAAVVSGAADVFEDVSVESLTDPPTADDVEVSAASLNADLLAEGYLHALNVGMVPDGFEDAVGES